MRCLTGGAHLFGCPPAGKYVSETLVVAFAKPLRRTLLKIYSRFFEDDDPPEALRKPIDPNASEAEKKKPRGGGGKQGASSRRGGGGDFGPTAGARKRSRGDGAARDGAAAGAATGGAKLGGNKERQRSKRPRLPEVQASSNSSSAR